MTELEMLTAGVASFGELVVSIGNDEWDQPSGAADWNLQSVVAHVVVTDSQAAGLIEGEEVSWVIDVDISVLGTNPVATWRGTALRMITAFSAPGILEQHFEHPLGRLSGRRLLGNRLSENVAHGWDLAQGLGLPYTIPDEMGEWLLDFWQPHLDALDPGFFDTPLAVDETAPAGARFLALVGRG
ncbi:MAG: TIGR03086 family metal-binding protein [Acidimicrobiales bacterium]